MCIIFGIKYHHLANNMLLYSIAFDENVLLYLLKFSVKEFVMESEPWIYNRKIDDEKVKELREQIKVFDNF